MNATFARLLLASLVAFAGAAIAAASILWWDDPYSDPAVVESALRPGLHLARAELEAEPGSDPSQQVRRLAPLFEGPLELRPLAQLPAEVQHRLLAEQDVVFWLDSESQGYIAIALDETRVLQQGPLTDLTMPAGFRWVLASGVVLVLFSVAIFVALRPTLTHLDDLQTAALAVGNGRFTVRVPESGDRHRRVVALAFNRMVDRLTNALSTQAQLLRAVSHELRTPLARLRFRTELLQSAPTQSAREEHAERLDEDIAALDDLVQELLTHAWLQHVGSTETETFALRSAIESLVSQRILPGVHDHLTVEVDVSGSLRVDTHRKLFARAIGNLVSNACRYAKARVRIRAAQDAHGVIELRVSDDGPGIGPELRERAFAPFETLGAERSEDGGTGLGLAIVHSIVASRGGDVRVADSEWSGCCVVVRWPATPIHADTV